MICVNGSERPRVVLYDVRCIFTGLNWLKYGLLPPIQRLRVYFVWIVGMRLHPPPLLLKVTGAHGKFQGGVFGALRQWASLTDSFTDQSDNWLLSGWGSKIQIDQYALSFWTS